MYTFIVSLLLLFAPQQEANKTQYVSPLAKYSAEWNNPKYKVCNTAGNAGYMTPREQELIHILNLVRMNPKLFCQTVVKKGQSISDFIEPSSDYYQSLVTDLNNLK